MASDHHHAWHGYTLRLLTLPQPDGLARVLMARRCRGCSRVERVTGSGTMATPGKALPPIETFWDAPRTKET